MMREYSLHHKKKVNEFSIVPSEIPTTTASSAACCWCCCRTKLFGREEGTNADDNNSDDLNASRNHCCSHACACIPCVSSRGIAPCIHSLPMLDIKPSEFVFPGAMIRDLCDDLLTSTNILHFRKTIAASTVFGSCGAGCRRLLSR